MEKFEKLVYRRCADESCGNEIYDPSRKLCWRCTNFKKRYGLTTGKLNEKREKDGKICFLCRKFKRVLINHGEDKKLCITCKKLATMMGDREWARRLVQCV